MNTLFIHCGLHKTGSTSLQFFCNRFRQQLRGEKLYYPLYIDRAGNKHQSHLQFIKDILAAIKPGNGGNNSAHSTQLPALEFVEQLRQHLKQTDDDVLISSENISSLNKESFGNFCDYISSIFNESKIVFIFSLRQQVGLAESLYRNGFRAMKKRQEPVEQFLFGKIEYLDYERRIMQHKEIDNSFDNASFIYLPYPSLGKNGIIPDFFRSIGLSILSENSQKSSANVSKNPSLDAIDCIAKDMLSLLTNDESIFHLFNRFAFASPIKTNYSFVQKAIRMEPLVSIFNYDYASHIGPGFTLETNAIHKYGDKVIDSDAYLLGAERLKAFLGSENLNHL